MNTRSGKSKIEKSEKSDSEEIEPSEESNEIENSEEKKMASSDESNKKKRGVVRSKVTNSIKKIDDLLRKEAFDHGIVSDLFELLSDYKQDLLKLDSVIEKETMPDDLEQEFQVALDYQENIDLCLRRTERNLKKFKTTEESSKKESTKDCTKLPKITIEKFYGDICRFQEFWSQFEVAVHKNSTLEEIEKFNYLTSLLADTAELAIRGLPLTAKNYKKAIEILFERFGRNEVLVNAHMQKLLNIGCVRRSSDVSSLRRFYDELSVNTRSLETLKVKSENYSALLIPILFKKIPPDLMLQFNRDNPRSQADLNCFMDFIRKELEARENTTFFSSPEESEKRPNEKRSSFGKPEPRPVRYSTASTMVAAGRTSLCLFCSQNHDLKDCQLTLNQRMDELKGQYRCFKCLKKNHRKFECWVKVKCSCCLSKDHEVAMCSKFLKKDENKEDPKETVPTQNVLTSTIQDSAEKTARGSAVYFQTLRCKAIGKGKPVEVRLLFDTGSARSFICKSLSQKLQLKSISSENLKIYRFGGGSTEERRTSVQISLKGLKLDEEFEVLKFEVLETEKICADVIRCPSEYLRREIDQLGIHLSDYAERDTNEIDVLIGADHYWKIVTGNIKRLSQSLVLSETKLGWTVLGSFSYANNPNNLISVMHVPILEDDKLSNSLQKFWNIEELGIKESLVNQDEKVAIEQFENSIKFVNNRYEARLPFKYEGLNIADNYDVAKKRLVSLVKRFRNDPLLFKNYKSVIDEYLSLGMVEEVEVKSKDVDSGKVIFYLPHHPVIRNDKTTSLRVVFDASSKTPGNPSLNDLLLPGPNLNSDLFDLLIKFRSNNVALVADLEKAFLQISLANCDRDAARFLWYDDIPETGEISAEPKVLRMTRVLFGVTSSPFLLNAVIKHHLKLCEPDYPETCQILNQSLYVDDLVCGSPNLDEALKLAIEAKEVFLKANMSLRKWQSNSSELKEKLRDLDFMVVPDKSEQSAVFKILGLMWDTEQDKLGIEQRNLLEFVADPDVTKRKVIKVAGRIFDPLGFLTPFTVYIKILFQSLWQRGLDWDKPLPEDLKKVWERWRVELPYIHRISIPRYYFEGLDYLDFDEVELHCFTDASEKAYGAVIYVKFKSDEGEVNSAFVTSKSRLAPIKKLSLPRLELMGALIGARLTSRIVKVLGIKVLNTYMWTDSNIALHWIRSSANSWKPFVSNRVSEIQSLIDPMQWKHCPGRENPADHLTRGLSILDLEKNRLWWFGPHWLVKNKDTWPAPKENELVLDIEERRNQTPQGLVTLTKLEPLVKLENFSVLKRAIRVIAWIKRFCFNSRNLDKRSGCLSAIELYEAEIYLIKLSQTNSFREEILKLKEGSQINRKSKIFDLNPYLDEFGLLRVGGRLNQSKFILNEKNPLIIPKDDRFTELLVEQEHVKVMHSGTIETLNKIRSKFWIPKGRQFVKKILRRCLMCRRFRAKAADQITGQLPEDRIAEAPPFSIIGVDFAGPIYVKTKEVPMKTYIVLFTCAVTRAIHLELVSGMSTKCFLLAFRRFIARRGTCKVVYSDNAKTFKASNKELQRLAEIFEEQELQDYISTEGISWKFNVERAPWWGGFFERMVKSVKEPLRKILGRASLTFEELTTVLSEVEALVNMRPLTFTTNDSGDPEPLTPLHFLQFGRRDTKNPLHFIELVNRTKRSDKEALTRRKIYQTSLLKQLWKRWKEQYLLQLRTAFHLKNPKKHQNLKKDDVVLVEGTSKSKLLWDLGIVEDIFLGRDGQVRSCIVRTSKGNLRRPVQMLYPLELC